MKRPRKKSILFLGEGADDEMFLRCVKNNFGSINKNVKPIDGHGGSPISIVEDLIKNELFDPKGKQYILMDSDRPKEELDLAKEKIKEYPSIKSVIYSKKCLEEELLKILAPNDMGKNSRKKSQELKTVLKKHCKNAKDYERLFTKKKLEQARINNKWLDSIIKIFE